MDKKVLVYQAYGETAVIQQALFSIASLLRFLTENDNLEIAVYTDQKKQFSDFFGEHPRLFYVELTEETVQKWKGASGFSHRFKIEAMKNAAGKYRGPLFYCDGDTVFKSSPMPLFRKVNERTSIMHKAEGALDQTSDPLSKKILAMVNKHHFQIQNELVGIGPSTVMWNAGVLGLCQTNKYLLDYILELTDKSYAVLKKHVMEQLAFSFFLQTHSEIVPAEPVIHHYWNQKAEFRKAIQMFFKEHSNVEKALENFENFKIPSPADPKPKNSLIRKVLLRK